MKQSLQLKQGLQLSLTPQLQQAIQLLQLNQIELQEAIQQMLDDNPLLEQIEDDVVIANPAESDITDEEQSAQQDRLNSIDLSDGFFAEQAYTSDWNEPAGRSSSYDFTSDELLSNKPVTQDIKQQLLWQLNTSKLVDNDRIIAYTLIDDIQSNGLLSTDSKKLYQQIATELDITFDEFEAVRRYIQHFEPLGCASDGLEDYLLFQLSLFNSDTKYLRSASQIIRRHSNLLAQGDYNLLKRRARLTEQELHQTISLIQSLSTEPYTNTDSSNLSYINPDFIVKKTNEGWTVQATSKYSEKLTIRQEYAELVNTNIRPQDQRFIQDNLQEARWFIRSLKNRDDTLLKVANKIMAHQIDFLEQGNIAIKPLTLTQIATEIDMHESTVSRATNGKYIYTPQGLFELKHFFSNQIGSDTGEEYSSTAIRAMIKELVEAEEPRKPYSDNKIATLLQAKGIQIARRTVAKYREELTIPPSTERRRLQ